MSYVTKSPCGPRYTIIDRIPYDRQNTTMDRSVETYGGGQDIDSFVNAFPADNLSTVYFLPVQGEYHLDHHGRRARIIPGMVVLIDIDDLIVLAFFEASLDQSFFAAAGGGRSQVEDFGDGSPLGSVEGFGLAGDIVRADSSLLVGGARQWNHCFFFADEIGDFNDVADGEDIRIGGFQEFIDDNAATGIEREPCVFCENTVGADTDG